MDQLLQPYLHASLEAESQARLDELLLLHAAPVIRRTVRNRLGISISLQGTNPQNPDAQDLYQEAMARVVHALNELRQEKLGIDDFRKYVAGIAANVCRDYLRARSPARRRLRDNIRLVLTRHPDFAMWQSDEEQLCGFDFWRHSSVPMTRSGDEKELTATIEELRSARFAREHPARLPLPRVLSDVFVWTGKPIDFNTVVKIVAGLISLREYADDSFDEETFPSVEYSQLETVSAQSVVEQKELLRHLWEVVKTLPSEQRDTYCFLFHDQRGWDLFSLLIEAEIVSLKDLGRALDRSQQEIIRLRSQMPMDGPTLAAELNVSRPQINKWRFRAVKNIRRELEMFWGKNKYS